MRMEAIWNNLQLERPPNATCCVERQKFDPTELLLTLDKIIKDLKSQNLLHKEAAILSRLIYRMKTKFRNDKGVKSMSKVNRALLKYLSLSLHKEYENLKDYIEGDEKYVILPSKQMVEYVLVKTQGFAKLMLRVEEVSKYSAHYLKSRIDLGHAWSMAIIAYSVVSRIWILSRYLVKMSSTWYNNLYQYLESFKVSGLFWLPKNYELPNDLKSWLSVPWIDDPTPSVPSNYELKSTIFKLIKPHEYDSDEDLFLDVQDYSKEINSNTAASPIKNENITHSLVSNIESKNIISTDDIGETVDRRAFNQKHIQNTPISTNIEHKKSVKIEEIKKKTTSVINSNQEFSSENIEDESVNTKKDKNSAIKLKNLTKQKISKKLLTFDNIKDKSDLMILLNKESYPGLDKLQWNMIRNKSKKLLDKLETCSIETKQSILFTKIMKRIKKLVS